jgi:F-type H+-transporting ATPase subunit a
MRLRSGLTALLLLAAIAPPSTARAQQEPAQPLQKTLGPADIIMPHITDSKHIEYPCFKSLSEWACEANLPVWPVHIGGKTYDFGPTKHVVFLALSGLVALVLLIGTARSHRKHSHEIGRPVGFAVGMESVILYLRNEIYLPVLGGGRAASRYVPFCLTLFFFILFCNLFGLLPWGSTPTGNVAVTATLALITFIVVEVAGIKALGAGYIGTIIYWPHDMPFIMKALMTPIMTPVELVGKFTKPFALTIRLFANMIAGHVIILALIGLIFMFGFKIAVLPLAMALFIMGLEILVAFIQAFIFSLLAAVFIGQIRSAHH